MRLSCRFGIYGKGKERGDYLRCMLGKQYMYSSTKDLTYYYTKQDLLLSLEETMPPPHGIESYSFPIATITRLPQILCLCWGTKGLICR